MEGRRRWALATAIGALLLVGLFALSSEQSRSWLGDAAGASTALDPEALGGPARGAPDDDSDRADEVAALGPDAGVLPLRAPARAEVRFDPESRHGALAGRVEARGDHAPVAGADLLFLHDGSATSVTSGPDGRFEIAAPEPGRYVLSIATAPGYMPFAPELGHSAIAFEARPERRIEGVVVTLRRERRFEVAVVDAEGGAVADARVRLVGAGSGERAMAPLPADYVTDADGVAEVIGWGGAVIEARHPRRGIGRGRIPWRADGGDRVEVTLGEAAPDETGAERIAGAVMDESGAPVEGAVVTAWRRARGLHPSAQGATDADGAFELTGLDRGAHVLTARHPAHPTARAGPIETGRDDVAITLAGGSSVRGRVVDEAGEPVPAFNVVARRAMGQIARRTVATVSSYDSDGSFEITGLREGDYELVAVGPGYPESTPVPVTAGASGEVVITLRRGGRVAGVVRSEDGEPVAGARVRVESHLGRGSSAAPLSASTVSSASGTFELGHLGDAPRSIHVTADGFHGRIVSGVRAPDEGVRRIEVVLTPVAEGEEERMELAGIGVSVFPRGEALAIGRVTAGGGAAAAGLGRGDRILAVDGVPVTELGFRGALERIRGQEGTTVVLRLLRGEEETPVDVPITRTRVRT